VRLSSRSSCDARREREGKRERERERERGRKGRGTIISISSDIRLKAAFYEELNYLHPCSLDLVMDLAMRYAERNRKYFARK